MHFTASRLIYVFKWWACFQSQKGRRSECVSQPCLTVLPLTLCMYIFLCLDILFHFKKKKNSGPWKTFFDIRIFLSLSSSTFLWRRNLLFFCIFFLCLSFTCQWRWGVWKRPAALFWERLPACGHLKPMCKKTPTRHCERITTRWRPLTLSSPSSTRNTR